MDAARAAGDARRSTPIRPAPPRPYRQRPAGIGHRVLAAAGAKCDRQLVKIVQRVPVKIVIDNPPADVALGPGMSVDPTVRVNPNLRSMSS